MMIEETCLDEKFTKIAPTTSFNSFSDAFQYLKNNAKQKMDDKIFGLPVSFEWEKSMMKMFGSMKDTHCRYTCGFVAVVLVGGAGVVATAFQAQKILPKIGQYAFTPLFQGFSLIHAYALCILGFGVIMIAGGCLAYEFNRRRKQCASVEQVFKDFVAFVKNPLDSKISFDMEKIQQLSFNENYATTSMLTNPRCAKVYNNLYCENLYREGLKASGLSTEMKFMEEKDIALYSPLMSTIGQTLIELAIYRRDVIAIKDTQTLKNLDEEALYHIALRYKDCDRDSKLLSELDTQKLLEIVNEIQEQKENEDGADINKDLLSKTYKTDLISTAETIVEAASKELPNTSKF